MTMPKGRLHSPPHSVIFILSPNRHSLLGFFLTEWTLSRLRLHPSILRVAGRRCTEPMSETDKIGGAVTENGAIYIPALPLQCRAHADHLGQGPLLIRRPKKFGTCMPLSPVTIIFKKLISNLVRFWAFPQVRTLYIDVLFPPQFVRSVDGP